ncbi:vanadium-dependent haloperoxidase [Haliscomenobacter sp.]|uniref:vanadium-dependent haloperoxidase n=1 Tax=Haliscomenobacter sp. TaxID=2717303 RepID=UPI0033652BDE
MKQLLRMGMALLMIGLITACDPDGKEINFLPTADEYDSAMVQDWMELTLKLTKESAGYTPPVAARMFGYVGLALFESVRPGIPKGLSMAGQVSGLEASNLPKIDPNLEYHWPLVGNAALGQIVNACYAPATEQNKFLIASLQQKHNEYYRNKIQDDIIKRSTEYGIAVANAIANYANSDGQQFCYQSNFPASYTVPTGESFWVPTAPAFQKIPLQPFWGKVRTFYPNNADVSLVPAPPTYSTDKTSPFYQQALEVYTTVKNLTVEQKTIAEYWSDDPGKTFTPPGHSIAITRQVLAKEEANLAVAAEAFARVGMGLHDAFVSCWNAKYTYNLMRPITYVKAQIDASWNAHLTTPPFPEYTSGHSTQSGATAQILSDLFGYNYVFTDRAHKDRTDINGSPRSFNTFFEFANEAALSRLYGGIHYRVGNEQGLLQGIRVGKNISKLKFRDR